MIRLGKVIVVTKPGSSCPCSSFDDSQIENHQAKLVTEAQLEVCICHIKQNGHFKIKNNVAQAALKDKETKIYNETPWSYFGNFWVGFQVLRPFKTFAINTTKVEKGEVQNDLVEDEMVQFLTMIRRLNQEQLRWKNFSNDV